MALNFRRHQLMEKLGIEQLPASLITAPTEDIQPERELNLPIRSQKGERPQQHDCAGPRAHATNANDEDVNPDGPLCDMTVPARKCPTCTANGYTTWVMPGKPCPRCETVVD